MGVEIACESHGTSLDNEAGLSSGHFDVDLSSLGERQAQEMGDRYALDELRAVFCSDLRRAYRTAEIAFAGRSVPIIRDRRLRECDYGTLTRHPRAEIDAMALQCITMRYPAGESWQEAVDRMRPFLEELLGRYDRARVLLIGHRATYYALEHWISGRPLAELVTERTRQQPGLRYQLERATFR